jgi:broad specificity phosphatase PhoE
LSQPTAGIAELVFLRHAESENVVAGASGAIPMAPLTDRGREQAAHAAADPAVAAARVLYASTAVRVRQTAEIIARTKGAAVIFLPELVEVGIGGAEGVVDATLRRETAVVLEAWVVDGDLERRIADGETGHDVLARMRTALDGIAAEHAGERAAVIGHVGSLTLALSVLCGLGSAVWGAPLPHAVPFAVQVEGPRWSCKDWPDPEAG